MDILFFKLFWTTLTNAHVVFFFGYVLGFKAGRLIKASNHLALSCAAPAHLLLLLICCSCSCTALPSPDLSCSAPPPSRYRDFFFSFLLFLSMHCFSSSLFVPRKLIFAGLPYFDPTTKNIGENETFFVDIFIYVNWSQSPGPTLVPGVLH